MAANVFREISIGQVNAFLEVEYLNNPVVIYFVESRQSFHPFVFIMLLFYLVLLSMLSFVYLIRVLK